METIQRARDLQEDCNMKLNLLTRETMGLADLERHL